MDDVVDGDHADQPPALVDHRGRDERIFLEAERHLLLIHVGRNQGLLALHDLGDRRLIGGAHQPAHLAGADRPVRDIDDEHLPEIGGEVVIPLQKGADVAHLPMFGHRDQIALHQAAG